MDNGFLKAVKKQEKELKKQEVKDLSITSCLPKVIVNKKVMDVQKKVHDELVELGGNEFYSYALYQLQTVIKLLRKVDLNNPYKQNILSRMVEIDLSTDFMSKTFLLYNGLVQLYEINDRFDEFMLDIDNLIIKVNSDIGNLNEKLSLTNKTIFLSQIKTLGQFKMSTMIVKECYDLILGNPEVQKFMFYWERYLKGNNVPAKTLFNDNIYLVREFRKDLMIDGISCYAFYNRIDRMIRLIWKYSWLGSAIFDMHVGMQYMHLKYDIYQGGMILDMVNKIDLLLEQIKKNDLNENEDLMRKYHALIIIKNEFLDLQEEVKRIINSPRISRYAKKEKLDHDFRVEDKKK